MRRLTGDHWVMEMSREHAPAYRIDPGERVVIETLDCYGGFVSRDGGLLEGHLANAATGPIEIAGSQPGEALAVTIHEVAPADWGFIGGGGESTAFSVVGKFTMIEMREGQAHFPWGLTLPLAPVVGVIGLAPAGEAVPTTTPGDHGGNLDTTGIGPGTTLFLPVAVEGARLALGDVHALQGDGESGGTGVECAATVTLSAVRVAQPLSSLPYLVRDDRLAILASAQTLDEAATRAVTEMGRMLAALTGRSEVEGRRLLSVAGDVRV
jgi:amidase